MLLVYGKVPRRNHALVGGYLSLSGIYMVIFGLCMHIIRHRQVSRLYRVCTISLFGLASLYVASTTFGLTRQAVVLFRASKTREIAPLVKYLRQDPQKTASV